MTASCKASPSHSGQIGNVAFPPRADLYSESNEGPVWGIKGRFLRPKLNGRCRIRKPPPDGPPPGDRRFFDRRTTGQQPVRSVRFFTREIRRGGQKSFGQRKSVNSITFGSNLAVLDVSELGLFRRAPSLFPSARLGSVPQRRRTRQGQRGQRSLPQQPLAAGLPRPRYRRGDRLGAPACRPDRAPPDPDPGPADRLAGAKAAARHRLTQANPLNPNRKGRQ